MPPSLPPLLAAAPPVALLHDRHFHASSASLARAQAAAPDMRTAVAHMRLPLLLIAGSDDCFVVPAHALHLARARAAAGRRLLAGAAATPPATASATAVNDAASGGASLADFLQALRLAAEPPPPEPIGTQPVVVAVPDCL